MNPLTAIASKCYAAAMRRRNARFDRGDRVTDVGLPVLSIGNLTVGGTGKTPMVQWVVRTLQEAGHVPIVALRGYGAGKNQLSDEAMEHAGALPGVPVLADPDRVGAIAEYRSANPGCDCVVLDDGFQHRFVARQLDVVLVDARRPLEQERVLPAGRLREPLSSLCRATDVVVTHARQCDETLSSIIRRWHGHDPVAWCDHVWTAIERFDSSGCSECAVDVLDGLRVVTRLGVGAAAGVRNQVQAAGATIALDVPARDHAPGSPAEMRRLTEACNAADALLVTAKDWVKLGPLVDWSTLQVPVLVPKLALSFLSGEAAFKGRVISAADPSESS